MDRSKLIVGIVFVVAATLIVMLMFNLPSDEVMFMIGDQNMPWVPALVLGIIGVVLLATAGSGEKAVREVVVSEEDVTDPQILKKIELNKRLEGIGWGLFLIMLGGFALVPHEQVPSGLWSVGLGIIMLGLNAARYYYGIRMSGFTTFLGVISLLSGVTQLLGWHTLDGAIFLIILGAYLILKPWFEKRQLFGKVAEG